MLSRVRVTVRWFTTRSGVLFALAIALGIWSVLGGEYARITGICAVVLAAVFVTAKLMFLDSALVRLREARAAQQDRLAKLQTAHEEARRGHRSEINALKLELSSLKRRSEASSQRLQKTSERLTKDLRALSLRAQDLERMAQRSDAHAADTRRLIRESIRVSRDEVAALRDRLVTERPEPVAVVTSRPTPVLSIAIPGYNRPTALETCLQAIVDQVDALDTDRVEVWVTDDCSTDIRAAHIAHGFAQRYPYVGFRSNPENLGLERNLIACCAPCVGHALWIVGNDDLIEPGALSTVLDDIDNDGHRILLYNKVRIDRTGTKVLRSSAGTMPASVESADIRVFDSPLHVARESGIISAFGFISTLVCPREPFMAVDATPYFGLSMYPQLGVLLEAFGSLPVLCHNVPIVRHRTQSESEKLAEAIGRPEESFMSGGAERNARWFGSSYAALLQRVVDRSALDVRELATLPELLFGEKSMTSWIEANRARQSEAGVSLDPEVEADAARFLADVAAATGS